MKLKNFVERDCIESNDVMGLSEYEQKLCNYFQRVELQGKGEKLLCYWHLKWPLQSVWWSGKEKNVACQKKASIYMLYHIVEVTTEETSASKNCWWMWGTKARLFDVHTVFWVFFIGHDISLHRYFYRLSEPTIQSAKISKVLLALEKGKLHDLRGKDLDNIGSMSVCGTVLYEHHVGYWIFR